MKVDLLLVSLKEAAGIRKVSVQAIHHLVQRGRFTIVEVSGKKFLLRQEVENFTPDIGGRPKTKEGKGTTKRTTQRTTQKRRTSKQASKA